MGIRTDEPRGRAGRYAGQVRYRAIYEDLKAKIVNREYGDGEMLPVERKLGEYYGVDRITVRRALELLVEENLLEKRAGLGSFVKGPQMAGWVQQEDSRNILFVMARNQNDVSSNPSAFNSELFYAVEREARQRNLSLFYAGLDEQEDFSQLVNGNSFAGILFVSRIPDGVLGQCAQVGAPAVCINNRHPELLSVVADDERGVYGAVEYLRRQGHERIGIVLGMREYYSCQERYRGFRSAMRDANFELRPDYVLAGDWTFDGARRATLQMLDALPPRELPTALFCCSDLMAIGAMDALKERGLHIPEDISVMGFDNVQQSSYVYPRLTTVSVDVKLMAALAVEQLLSLRERQLPGGYAVYVPTALVERQSVASAPALRREQSNSQ